MSASAPGMFLMNFPEIKPKHGLLPDKAIITPKSVMTNGESMLLTLPFLVDRPVIIDFGCHVMGSLYIEANGELDYIWATDHYQMDYLLMVTESERISCGPFDVYPRARPWGTVSAGHLGQKGEKQVFRLLRLAPRENPVTVYEINLQWSGPSGPLDGWFECDDQDLNRIWHTGVYTIAMCAQNNRDALVPVIAPGSGRVIWDGARRDREVWGGDLRPSSLTWLYALNDPEPVLNSLLMIWQGKHAGCEHDGLIPGSAASHQIFYEWSFWFLVNAWEYYMLTADEEFLFLLSGPAGLRSVLEWIKKHLNEHGLIEATNSWMYTIKISGETSGLAMAQIAGLDALASLFTVQGDDAGARESTELARTARRAVCSRFFDSAVRALSLHPNVSRYPLDGNSLAVLFGTGNPDIDNCCIRWLMSSDMWTPSGLPCFTPAYSDVDGNWYAYKELSWMHNEQVWPYVNCYAAWALMQRGYLEEGLNILKSFALPMINTGHTTLWEALPMDGSNPAPRGNMVSLCHAWSGLGSYLMQRYLLGIKPESPGYRKISINPGLGYCKYVSGTVPTPLGPVSVAFEQDGRGIAEVPPGIEVVNCPQNITIVRR